VVVGWLVVESFELVTKSKVVESAKSCWVDNSSGEVKFSVKVSFNVLDLVEASKVVLLSV